MGEPKQRHSRSPDRLFSSTRFGVAFPQGPTATLLFLPTTNQKTINIDHLDGAHCTSLPNVECHLRSDHRLVGNPNQNSVPDTAYFIVYCISLKKLFKKNPLNRSFMTIDREIIS